MPVIVVNTAADTVASDGKTSLREAVAQAAGMTGKVSIVFDVATFYNVGTNSVTAIQLSQTLTIGAGDITIDGSLLYPGAFLQREDFRRDAARQRRHRRSGRAGHIARPRRPGLDRQPDRGPLRHRWKQWRERGRR
jgi:CSLREA domain-containing protein